MLRLTSFVNVRKSIYINVRKFASLPYLYRHIDCYVKQFQTSVSAGDNIERRRSYIDDRSDTCRAGASGAKHLRPTDVSLSTSRLIEFRSDNVAIFYRAKT